MPELLRDSLRKVFDVPSAPAQQQESRKPKDGAKLKPGTEERLKWGEPVNGLRAALIIRHATDKRKAEDKPDLYLVLQNVSKAPIRLSDANVPANVRLRELSHKKDGRTLYIAGAREPVLGDFMLQPREVAFLPMFSQKVIEGTADKSVNGHTIGSHLAEDALRDARQTLLAKLEIEKAPPEAWTGKLVTGDTSGSEAAGQPPPKDNEAKALYKMSLGTTGGDHPGVMLLYPYRGTKTDATISDTDATIFDRGDSVRTLNVKRPIATDSGRSAIGLAITVSGHSKTR